MVEVVLFLELIEALVVFFDEHSLSSFLPNSILLLFIPNNPAKAIIHHHPSHFFFGSFKFTFPFSKSFLKFSMCGIISSPSSYNPKNISSCLYKIFNFICFFASSSSPNHKIIGIPLLKAWFICLSVFAFSTYIVYNNGESYFCFDICFP